MEIVNAISNIDLNYARQTQQLYGTQGVPRSFRIDPSFLVQMTACFDEIIEECPLGKPNIITCAGIYANRAPSLHTSGNAFDLDALFWDDYNLVSLNFFHDKELYLAIESFLRKHNGIVLSYFYNNDHKDHWHIDNSVSVDFEASSRSSVLYMQLVSSYIYNYPIEIDGIFGPQTSGAMQYMLDLLGLTGQMTTSSTYKAFLKKTGRLAFLKFEQEKTPLKLLNNVYEVVENLDINIGDINAINQALNDFRNHSQTESWLEGNFMADANIEDLIVEIA